VTPAVAGVLTTLAILAGVLAASLGAQAGRDRPPHTATLVAFALCIIGLVVVAVAQ
jgi:hypothetical protein